jgi:YgiT-type zinc finger domain-containing protein
MDKCRSCLSTNTYEERKISHPLKLKDRVVIFENVPASVCSQCGETLFQARTVERMEQLGRGKRAPNRVERVPVYDLAEAETPALRSSSQRDA